MRPGLPYALCASLPGAWAVVGEEVGPICLHAEDAHGNKLPAALRSPHVETRVAAPLRANGGEAPTALSARTRSATSCPGAPWRTQATGAALPVLARATVQFPPTRTWSAPRSWLCRAARTVDPGRRFGHCTVLSSIVTH